MVGEGRNGFTAPRQVALQARYPMTLRTEIGTGASDSASPVVPVELRLRVLVVVVSVTAFVFAMLTVAVSTFSVKTLEAVFQNVVGHLLTRRLAIIASGPEVNAAKDAGVLDFIEGRGKTCERASHPDRHIRIEAERSLITKEVREHGGCRSACSRVAGWILRMRRRDDEGSPTRIFYCRGIPVSGAERDGRHGPPEDISVFGVPAGNSGVRKSDVEQSQQPRLFQESGVAFSVH